MLRRQWWNHVPGTTAAAQRMTRRSRMIRSSRVQSHYVRRAVAALPLLPPKATGCPPFYSSFSSFPPVTPHVRHPAAQISAFCLAPRHCGDSTTQIGSGISSPCLSLFSQVCLCPAWNGPWKNASSRPAIVDLDRTRMMFLSPFLRF